LESEKAKREKAEKELEEIKRERQKEKEETSRQLALLHDEQMSLKELLDAAQKENDRLKKELSSLMSSTAVSSRRETETINSQNNEKSQEMTQNLRVESCFKDKSLVRVSIKKASSVNDQDNYIDLDEVVEKIDRGTNKIEEEAFGTFSSVAGLKCDFESPNKMKKLRIPAVMTSVKTDKKNSSGFPKTFKRGLTYRKPSSHTRVSI
jgi:hypothetical protein